MESARQKEAQFKYGAGLDEKLPTDRVIETLQSLEGQFESQISTIPDDDPDYANKVQEIKREARVAQYKAMKSLNSICEGLPPRKPNPNP